MKRILARVLHEVTLRRASRWKWFRRWVGGRWEKRQAHGWIDGMVPVVFTYWSPADVKEESSYNVLFSEDYTPFPKATVKAIGP
jgi:hypothetical protein